METLFLLIPLSLMLMVAIVDVFWWVVGSGQYNDLKAPAESILLDLGTPTRDAVSRDGTA